MPPFAKGQSGNPKGRPKGARNIARLFLEEIERNAAGTEGTAQQITKLQTLIQKQIDNATGGDNRAIEAVLKRVEEIGAKLDAAAGHGFVFTSADREVIAEIYRRLSAPADTESTPDVPRGAKRHE